MGERLMFCATDAGGARNLAPVAAMAGSCAIVVASETTAPLFAECGIESSTLPIGDAVAAAAVIGRERPAALICGTSRYIGAERRLTMAARASAVPTVAVLDEWFEYRVRFTDEGGNLAYLAELVCCPDEVARREAADEGLPASHLLVTGSPSLSALADRIAGFATNPPPLPEQWRNADAAMRILFLSETHKHDYGSGPDRPGPLGAWLGYTELDVRAALARVLLQRGIRCAVVEKLHPSATESPSPPEPSPAWQVVDKAPLWPLLWHADVVIGMLSMALLEAALMGHRALSFQPNLKGADRCTAARLGLADRARSEDELGRWLRSPPRRGAVQRPAFADSRSAGNVLQAALRLVCNGATTAIAASS